MEHTSLCEQVQTYKRLTLTTSSFFSGSGLTPFHNNAVFANTPSRRLLYLTKYAPVLEFRNGSV